MKFNFKNQYELALKIATQSHLGQVDKAGLPFINHPKTVSSFCKSDKAKVIALLHDTIEDCNESVEGLVEKGIDKDLAQVVAILTKGIDEDYLSSYIVRVKESPLAIEVKLADLQHNMDLSRLPHEPTEHDLKRQKKYQKAKEILMHAQHK